MFDFHTYSCEGNEDENWRDVKINEIAKKIHSGGIFESDVMFLLGNERLVGNIYIADDY